MGWPQSSRSSRAGGVGVLLGMLTTLLFASATQALDQGQERSVPVPAPEFSNVGCWQPTAAEPDMIDNAREGLDEILCEANLWLDGLFGAQPDVDAARRTRGLLSTAMVYSERVGWDFKLRLRVRTELNNLKNRLSAFVGREPDADFVSGRSEGFALREQFPVLEDEDQWLAGLGYELPTGYRVRSSLKVGARRLTDTELFVRYRMSWNALANPSYLLNLRMIPFWTNKDEFGLTAGMDYALALSDIMLLRWDLVGTQSASTEKIDWRGTTVLYRSFAAETGLAGEIYATGDTGDAEALREYGLRMILRFPLSSRRLYMLSSVGQAWYQPPDASAPRDRYFNASVELEMPFGR